MVATLGTRARILDVTSRLMMRQGYEGTAVKQIATEARVALSSVYHFFPGGKQELATAAVRHADEHFAQMLRDALATKDDPADAVVALAWVVAEYLRDSGWQDGCPITATALETLGRIPPIQQAVEEAFERWRGLVAEKFQLAGIAEQEARDLAHTVISTLEGAELAAQVSRSAEPMTIAGRHLSRLVNTYR
ncbi:TetR/AcrR family transcriptional regulator [Streptomyces sp. AC536]|uniref:TetR/AcrR family transcriptional regulator n=1 Tax=Streptomyces buecherae TaxID=2763006 RepID=UPI00164D3DB6|nr:TetR/AcrR family transcriptional regulator [Streptomyces buecherae]MBC3983703.1 TetR/AcrR family transcriptional regulator [Streptomyces buecherae]QNJ41545.1 TetR/AcrR family transcriptional regulator [Streptomyces buecherae]